MKLEEQLVQIRNKQQECLTINLLASILWKDRHVLTLYHQHSLVEVNNCILLQLHTGESSESTLKSLRIITGLLQELLLLPELPTVIDVGVLKDSFEDSQLITKESLISKLWYSHLSNIPEQKDVVLYGQGNIACFLAREMCEDQSTRVNLNLRAIVINEHPGVEVIHKMASLINHSSGYGRQRCIVKIDELHQGFIINGHFIRIINANETREVNYKSYGIDHALLIDTEVAYRDRHNVEKHLNSLGIDKVILTGSCTDIPHIIFGVNHDLIANLESDIYATACSSTNAVAPVIHMLENKYGIIKGHIQYICPTTDEYPVKDMSRMDFGITAKVFPSLTGCLSCNVIRVPIFEGSLAILVLEMKKKVTLEDVNEFFRMSTASHSKSKVLDISYDEAFDSNNILQGNTAMAVIEGRSTKVSFDGSMLTLYIWYDKDYGYCRQIIKLASMIEISNNPSLTDKQNALCYN